MSSFRLHKLLPRLLLALAISSMITLPGAVAAEPATAPNTLRMVIDYGDGVEKHFTAIPFKQGMTALDALKYAQKHPRGIKFEGTGSGATYFITSLDGIENQAGEGQDKNWIFSVNDKKGNKSCAVTELKPTDVVRWKYETFQF